LAARTLPLVVVSLSVFFLATPARPGHPDGSPVDRLSDRSFKVRLQAAILMGNQNLGVAAPALRRVLMAEKEHTAVRAAAAASLGRLGDEESRARLVALLGHHNKLLARAAEKALLLLDRRLGQPAYLVTVAPPGIPAGESKERAERILEVLNDELAHTHGLVMGSGEERVLGTHDLQAHLYRRGLRGLALEPQLVDLTTRVSSDAAQTFGTTRIRVLDLVDQTTQFVGTGEADAWVADPDISDAERIMLEGKVIDESLDAALTEVLDFLSAP